MLLINYIHVSCIIATTNNWVIRQLDVKNTVFNGFLKEAVYIAQPPGFTSLKFPNYVCHLKHALYGFKQNLRAWF